MASPVLSLKCFNEILQIISIDKRNRLYTYPCSPNEQQIVLTGPKTFFVCNALRLNRTACRFAEKRGFSARVGQGGAVPPRFAFFNGKTFQCRVEAEFFLFRSGSDRWGGMAIRAATCRSTRGFAFRYSLPVRIRSFSICPRAFFVAQIKTMPAFRERCLPILPCSVPRMPR